MECFLPEPDDCRRWLVPAPPHFEIGALSAWCRRTPHRVAWLAMRRPCTAIRMGGSDSETMANTSAPLIDVATRRCAL